MALISQEDIEEYTGYSEADFKKGGVQFTESEWANFCSTIINLVTQVACRYCNVSGFEARQCTEYHNGKGPSLDEYSAWSPTYQEWDRIYVPMEQPVISIDSVAVDIAGISNIPNWQTRTQRSTTIAGDYEVLKKHSLTYIRFHTNVPLAGTKNVRITYTAGYSPNSPELYEIKMCLLKMAANVLSSKKKLQEAITVRQMGIRDYSQMFEALNEGSIITEDVRSLLGKYRRPIVSLGLYD